MSFGREIKDFLDAYGKGADRAQKDQQLKQTGEYYKTLAAAQQEKLANDPAHIAAGAGGNINLNARDTGAVPGAALPAEPQKISAAILGQESGNNPNVATSVDGAHGRGQITPGTFAMFARPGESIDNDADNIAVHNRIIGKYAQAYGNDPARVAVAYFSGPGNVAPPGSPVPWKADKTDGNGKSVSGYVSDVARRLGRQAQAIPTDDQQPEQFAASGGLIDDPTYNDKAEYFAQDAAQQAPAPAPQALPVDNPPMPPRRPAPSDMPVPVADDDTFQHVETHASLPEALHAGLMKLQDMFGLKSPGAIDDGSQAAAQRGFVASTAGVVPPKEIDALHKAVDPDDKLSLDLKNLAGINAVYKHYMSIGDIDKAQKAAASLIQSTRVMVATYGHDAEARLKAGDVTGAVKSLQKADQLTPTGTRIEPSAPDANGNGTYVVKDSMSGRTLKAGRYTPGDLMAMAGIAANGTGYLNAVAKVAKPALPDEDTDDSASKAAFTSAMTGLGGGAPGAPRPGAIPVAAPAPAATPASEKDDDDDGDEDTSSGGDTDKDAAGSPAAAATGAGSGLPSGGGGVGGAGGGGAATPPPQFNNAAYAQMNKEHQQAYARAYAVQLQQWKASQPKAQKPEKPPSPKETNALADGVKEALTSQISHITNPDTLDPYSRPTDSPDVQSKAAQAAVASFGGDFQTVRDIGIDLARRHGMPHDTAAATTLQLVDVDPEDPSRLNFAVHHDNKGQPIAGPDGRYTVVTGIAGGPRHQISLTGPQLAEVMRVREGISERLAEAAAKRDEAGPGAVDKLKRGAGWVASGTARALSGNGPSMAAPAGSYAERLRRAREAELAQRPPVPPAPVNPGTLPTQVVGDPRQYGTLPPVVQGDPAVLGALPRVVNGDPRQYGALPVAVAGAPNPYGAIPLAIDPRRALPIR